MSVTAKSAPNIALIKYWGNRNNDYRLPAAASLSMTLNSPTVTVTVNHSEYTVLNSTKELTPTDIGRFKITIENIKRYLISIGKETALPGSINVKVESEIPPGIGLASSSAVFAALAKAIAELADASLTDEQVSVMARLGSGSACRSIHGGFVAMENIGDDMGGAIATQIADEKHWPLCDIVIAPDTSHKKVGSSEGHRSASTSPKFDARIRDIGNTRQQECVDAILNKDFAKLMHVAEADCMDMHAVMQTQTPPLQYLSTETERLVKELQDLRSRQHLPLLCTMDAGPTIHVICEPEAKEVVLSFAKQQASCQTFETLVGKGSYSV